MKAKQISLILKTIGALFIFMSGIISTILKTLNLEIAQSIILIGGSIGSILTLSIDSSMVIKTIKENQKSIWKKVKSYNSEESDEKDGE